MKKILTIILFAVISTFGHFQNPAFGQNDTSAYQTQRLKINNLLSDRSSKFGRYDNSLSMRTGIFGLKTKKDMQRSIDILTEIVQTDNNIFKELKILLDYKDLEKTTVESRAVNNEGRITNYMQTITKLQQQNDQLKTEMLSSEKKQNTFELFLYITTLISLILAFLLFKSKKLT